MPFPPKTPSRVLRQSHSYKPSPRSTPLHPTPIEREKLREELGFPVPMAVADDAVKPSPPPRIVAAVLALVRFVLAAMLAFGRVAARALPYLCCAIAWVHSAAWAASVVARRACREGSAPLLFFKAFTDAAFKFSICIIFLFLAVVAVLLCRLCLAYVIAIASGSGSEFKKSAFGAIKQESIKLPRAVVLGLVADLPFILLILAGILVVMVSSHVEGSISQGVAIGSVLVDVGVFGFHAISCFVIIPALALNIWRDDQSDKKAGLTVADC